MSVDPSIGQLVTGMSILLNLYYLVNRSTNRAERRELVNQPVKVSEEKPLHALYASKDHEHPAYLKREDCADRHAQDELREAERIKNLRDDIATLSLKIDTYNGKQEERASALHTRINHLLEPISSLAGRFSDHVRNHELLAHPEQRKGVPP